MGFNLTFHLSYRVRILLLFTLCLMVVGWATSNYFVDVFQELPTAKNVRAYFNKATVLDEEATPTTQALIKTADLENCPSLSPHLKGQSKLVFKPDLTLEEVQAENPKVHQGRYHPEECKALQRVAILIPHRNREKHLMYLLEHLHPFLQRQQIDYGIYVIHQILAIDNLKLLVLNSRNEKLLRYKGYFGGVTALTREQFFKVNGFSNNYWGWGGEDDDLRLRVELQRMKIFRPVPEVGKYTMIFHTRDRGNEVNIERMKLLHQVSRVWKTDGLTSCSYKLLSLEHYPLYVNITVDFWTDP
ncbi:beta-1,4-galactosyltransferase 4 [Echinops telfairi]|uniref:Beta-1,4-galactosyltransferase n=1 Tax=Echinops telfairi TaxID=9371 RepID=A0ABM0IS71_ECHTE|nr:beta-1,4-galactosyltransferase 4 [Echinops telfairi]